MEGDRELDIIVFGATGFVGKLTAKYLAENGPADKRIKRLEPGEPYRFPVTLVNAIGKSPESDKSRAVRPRR